MYKALLVGLGQIGMGYDLELSQDIYAYSHARALSLHPEFKLVAAVEFDSSLRKIFEKTYGSPAYGSIEDALEQKRIDLAVIATPTETHYPVLQSVLDGSKPKAILCEKPLSYSLTEARQILSLCQEKQVLLYVNYMRRSEPGALEVKRRIDSGEIQGPMKGIVWYSKGFLHNGSHTFNLLEDWLGNMKDFSLIAPGQSFPSGDVELDVRVLFEKGEVVFIVAKEENFSLNSIELVAKNGRLRYENGGRSIKWTPIKCDNALKGYTFLAETSEEIPSELNRYQLHVIEQLANALNGNPSCLCEGRQALQTLESMHSILTSRV